MDKMKHITVVYFNPTGGTRKACLNLTMEIGKKVKNVDLYSLEGEYSFGPGDTVVVDVPMFGGRIPGYVTGKLTHLKGSGAVALTATVYGDRTFEDALLRLDDCLRTQGFRIRAGTVLLAEHSVVRDVAAGRPDNQNRKEVADFGARILEKLKEEDWQEPQVPGNRPYRDRKQIPVTPLANASCISCGLCTARCPMQAIPTSSPSSTDQAYYILCIRYISVCPIKAKSLPEQACAILEQKLSLVRDIRQRDELFL